MRQIVCLICAAQIAHAAEAQELSEWGHNCVGPALPSCSFRAENYATDQAIADCADDVIDYQTKMIEFDACLEAWLAPFRERYAEAEAQYDAAAENLEAAHSAAGSTREPVWATFDQVDNYWTCMLNGRNDCELP